MADQLVIARVRRWRARRPFGLPRASPKLYFSKSIDSSIFAAHPNGERDQCDAAPCARRVPSGGRLLDPQSTPACRRNLAVDQLAAVRRHEKVAAVALVAVLRAGLIMDRGLRDLGLRLAARQRHHGDGAGGGKKDSAAADAGCFASLAHERLLRR